MIFEPMDRIVFAGDSVTDMGSAQPVGEGLFDNVGQRLCAHHRKHAEHLVSGSVSACDQFPVFPATRAEICCSVLIRMLLP